MDGQGYALSFTGRGITGARSKTFRISATGFDFGSTPLGSTAPTQTVTITNVGAAAVVGSIAGGGAGQFGGSQNCQGVTIAPGASCQVSYAFRPTSLGVTTGSTSGTFDGQPFAFTFRGTGVRQWLISPLGFDFGDTRPGSTAQQAVTIRNVGIAAAVGSIAGGGAGQFGGSQNCQGVTIAAGASCQVSYVFAPTTNGATTGTTSGPPVSRSRSPSPASADATCSSPRWAWTSAARPRAATAASSTSPSRTCRPPGDRHGHPAREPGGPHGGDDLQRRGPHARRHLRVPGDVPTAAGAVAATYRATVNGVAFAVTLRGRGT